MFFASNNFYMCLQRIKTIKQSEEEILSFTNIAQALLQYERCKIYSITLKYMHIHMYVKNSRIIYVCVHISYTYLLFNPY